MLSLGALAFAMKSIQFALSGVFDLAAASMLVGCVFDILDGAVARRCSLVRDFGRYLDSAIDVILYLLAPAVFLYMRGFSGAIEQTVLFLFVSCGVIRLSVFNKIGNVRDEHGRLAYLGMPVLWSVFWVALLQLLSWHVSEAILLPLIVIIVLSHSICMVLNRSFFKIKPNATTMSAVALLIALLVLGHLDIL